MDFVNLDTGTEWAAWVTPYVYLAERDVVEARKTANNMGTASMYHRELMVACTQEHKPVEIEKIAREAELSVMREPDPEMWFHLGELMSNCGQQHAAIRLLRGAIQQNYCGYEALQIDPLLVKLRGIPEFSGLQLAAKNCQHALGAATPESTMRHPEPHIPILKEANAEYPKLVISKTSSL